MTEEAIIEWHKNQVRSKRLELLISSDWTQLSAGNPLSSSKKSAWKTYRQKLRDLPSTITELNDAKGIDVVWPTAPA
jgi:hypothetical protein